MPRASESDDFLYKMTAYYDAKSERALRWDDPRVGIAWPGLELDFVLSSKDAAAPCWNDMWSS